MTSPFDPQPDESGPSRRPDPLDPGHDDVRGLLRTVGPVLLLAGLIFMAVGVVSFFSAFGSFGPPRYFWCCFVGIPLMAIGGAVCKFAFMGAVSRYIADEVAPVGKDVINYMADGTQGAVRQVAAAVGEGLREGTAGQAAPSARCPQCHTVNEASANFCKSCGSPLTKSAHCPACGGANDPHARFCEHCGKGLS